MRTNIDIDETLMKQAMAALGARTKREAVEESLRRTVKAKEQLEAIKGLRGIGWDGDLDDMRTSKHIPAE